MSIYGISNNESTASAYFSTNPKQNTTQIEQKVSEDTVTFSPEALEMYKNSLAEAQSGSTSNADAPEDTGEKAPSGEHSGEDQGLVSQALGGGMKAGGSKSGGDSTEEDDEDANNNGIEDWYEEILENMNGEENTLGENTFSSLLGSSK